MTRYSFDAAPWVTWIKAQPEHDTRTYAQHLRGKVTVSNGLWEIRVVNLDTGRTVVRDDGRIGLARAFAATEFATAAAREAWMRGLTKESLQRKGQTS